MPKQATTEIPGEGVEIRGGVPDTGRGNRNYTNCSALPDFATIKHLLSARPLRRPRRTRPA